VRFSGKPPQANMFWVLRLLLWSEGVRSAGRLRRVDRLLCQRIEDEEFTARRRSSSFLNPVSGFMQALDDFNADSGVVGLAFEDLVGTVAVERSPH
jgi:hypothetical protein